MSLASALNIPEDPDLASLASLRPSLSSPPERSDDDDPDAPGSAPLAEAMAMLSRGRFEEAKEELSCLSSRALRRKAVPLAQDLVRQGGRKYASFLGEVAMSAVEFRPAAQGFHLALEHHLDQGVPLDAPGLQPIRSRLVEALACAGDGRQALPIAAQSLEIAERAEEPRDIACALLGFGYVHLALDENTKAEEALLGAREHMVRDGGTQSADARRILAALCDVLGAQGKWRDTTDLLDDLQWSEILGDARHYWRIRGWSGVAYWRLQGEVYEKTLLADAGLKPEPWALQAAHCALEHLAAGMRDPAAGASRSLVVSVRDWLVEALHDAGRDNDAARIISLKGPG